MKGEGGWTEVSGCPVFTNDDGPKGVQAMSDILTANPNLSAFVIEGGWPLFGAPQPYRDLFKPLAARIASNDFVVSAADTIVIAVSRTMTANAIAYPRTFFMCAILFVSRTLL